MSTDPGAKWREVFGENVRMAREAVGLTQSQLAAKLEHVAMTRDKIAKIERGTRPTPVGEAYELARALDVPLDELMMEPITFDSLHMLKVQVESHMKDRGDITASVLGFMRSRAGLEVTLESLGPGKDPKMRDALAAAQDALSETVAGALSDAVWMYLRETQGQAPTGEQVAELVRELVEEDPGEAPGV